MPEPHVFFGGSRGFLALSFLSLVLSLLSPLPPLSLHTYVYVWGGLAEDIEYPALSLSTLFL